MDLSVKPFTIRIYVDGKAIRLRVEQVHLTDQIEKFKVIARNKTLVFQSDRPLLRRRSLHKRKPKFSLIDGTMEYQSVLEVIVDAIYVALKQIEKSN